MLRQESGERSSPIWLLLNPKFPAVRQDIWAPILEVIQDTVYRKLHRRIDTKYIFIKNIISDTGKLPDALNRQASNAGAQEIMSLREAILKYQPKLLFAFGNMTNELIRRILEVKGIEPKYWCTANLGKEFERSLANYDVRRINRIPLPCRVMKSGKFVDDLNFYSWADSEDYFRYAGGKIAERIIENEGNLQIWLK